MWNLWQNFHYKAKIDPTHSCNSWGKETIQMSHLNGLSPLCIAPMCWVNIVLVVKVLPHISHLNTFFLSWPEEIWVSDLLFIMKFNLKHFFTFFIFFDNYHSGCQIAEWLVVMETLILRVTHATYYQGTVLQFSKEQGLRKRGVWRGFSLPGIQGFKKENRRRNRQSITSSPLGIKILM